MQKSERIVSYTAEELASMESETDWERVRALTHEEIEASIDFEDEGEFDLRFGYPGLPPIPENKQQITLRIDADVLDWFKATGKGYQTRMNDELRRFVGIQKLEEAREASRRGSVGSGRGAGPGATRDG
jgi:uncharacterized protein (DUF4415 family)